MTNLTDIEQKIIHELEHVTKDAYVNHQIKTDAQWTKYIKQRLCDLGQREGYNTCASGFPDVFENEWLYDIVWYRNNDEKRVKEISLIVESEWVMKHREIQYDFEKLLQSNATHRLMICQVKNESFDSLISYFRNAVSDYDQLPSGSRFLVAILDYYNPEQFHYEPILKG